MRFAGVVLLAALSGCLTASECAALALQQGEAGLRSAQVVKPEATSKDRFELPEGTSGYVLKSVVDCVGYDGPIIRIPPVRFDHARDGDNAIVEFMVTAHGRTTDIVVTQSSNPNLNEAIVKFVRRWSYSRDCVEGELVERTPMYQRVRMDFTVEEPVGKSGTWAITVAVIAQSSEPF